MSDARISKTPFQPRAEYVICVTGGAGTADMVRRAKAADIRVTEVQP